MIIKIEMCDGIMELPLKVANMCEALVPIINEEEEQMIPLTEAFLSCGEMYNIKMNDMKRIISYCLEYLQHDNKKEKNKSELNEWEKEHLMYLQYINVKERMNLMSICNFLDNKVFMDTLCKYVANEIRGKSPNEIEQYFTI
jgi:Skp1 family, dimerisation domain